MSEKDLLSIVTAILYTRGESVDECVIKADHLIQIVNDTDAQRPRR